MQVLKIYDVSELLFIFYYCFSNAAHISPAKYHLIICTVLQNGKASAAAPTKKSWIPADFGGSGKHDATIDIPLYDPKKREKELLSWEEDLKRRERDIIQRENAMNRGIVVCLSWNVFAVLVESIHGEDIVLFLLAVIYAIFGCPLSYILWYRPLYQAMRTDSVVTFGQFFVFYSMHVGFCVIAAIAPPVIFMGKTLTGILVAIDVLNGDMFVGILYLIGFVLFTAESLISIWVLERVYMYFRGHR
uniref:Uncharacterized protein n=1 Tax=Avena sativa TaxID=4498 RepID=A0ACD6ABF5_AVESA